MTEIIEPPFGGQCFTSFQEWVNKASSWLTRHPDYNNTQHPTKYADKGYRGPHFTAMCFDSFGRRCRQGLDFQRAHDEGAFPVWWIWPDQIIDLIGHGAALASDTPVPLHPGLPEGEGR